MTDDAILEGVLVREGGFADHPADRGGATRYGITAATLGSWRKLGRQATREEVRALGVLAIELVGLGHALLFDEDAAADRDRIRRRAPVAALDREAHHAAHARARRCGSRLSAP